MTEYSTREAAKKLGLSPSGLSKHIRLGKIPEPKMVKTGRFTIHLWTEADIERVRKLLPKIKNGRKTRYQKREQAIGNRPQGKTRKKKQKREQAIHGKPGPSAGNRPQGKTGKKKQKREQAIGNRPQSEKAKSESEAKEPQPRAPQPRPAQKQRQRTSGAPAAVPHKKKQK